MERTVLMIRPEQRAKLAELAAHAHVSAAEINRRAIDAYDPESNDQELALLMQLVIRSTQEAHQALKEARKAVQESLMYFANKQGESKNGSK